MTRLLWKQITGVIAAACCVTLAWMLPKQTQAEPPSPLEQTTVTTTTQPFTTPTTAQPVSTVYAYIGEYQGRLAVYASDGATVKEIYDVYIVTLPEQEQERLRAKIPVMSQTELALLLEDYTS